MSINRKTVYMFPLFELILCAFGPNSKFFALGEMFSLFVETMHAYRSHYHDVFSYSCTVQKGGIVSGIHETDSDPYTPWFYYTIYLMGGTRQFD